MTLNDQATNQFQTIIIGGGVVGLSLAWELSRRRNSRSNPIDRRPEIVIIEAGEAGGSASWAGAGILPPVAKVNAVDPYEQLRSYSQQLHAQWSEQLLAETGIDNGFRRCGGIYLASTVGEQATLAANNWWWREHGVDSELLDANRLIELEPQLASFARERLKSAWLLPDECQLRNPRHLRALAAACHQNNVSIRSQTPVMSLKPNDTGSVRVETPDAILTAEQVCICSGAWARQALLDLGIDNGIMPVRGQIVLYRGAKPRLNRVINEGHRYLVPRDDGLVLAGSVEEEVGYVNETTEVAIEHIRHWAEGIVPALRECSVERCWSGLRPGSYDSLPYLGCVPGWENLFVAAGHFRSGLHLSCATAVTMADLMLGIEPAIDLAPFRVGR